MCVHLKTNSGRMLMLGQLQVADSCYIYGIIVCKIRLLLSEHNRCTMLRKFELVM